MSMYKLLTLLADYFPTSEGRDAVRKFLSDSEKAPFDDKDTKSWQTMMCNLEKAVNGEESKCLKHEAEEPFFEEVVWDWTAYAFDPPYYQKHVKTRKDYDEYAVSALLPNFSLQAFTQAVRPSHENSLRGAKPFLTTRQLLMHLKLRLS